MFFSCVESSSVQDLAGGGALENLVMDWKGALERTCREAFGTG